MDITNTNTKSSVAYIGPVGAGFGFKLAGINVHECVDADGMVGTLKSLVQQGNHNIIFVDETLAKHVLDIIAKLNQNPLPAIILLANPVEAQKVAATNLQKLMVRAIGSDIFEGK